MYGLIYLVENKVNGRCYIGQSIQRWPLRKWDHVGHPKDYSLIDRAIKKYGKNNFEWTVIDEADNQEVLNSLEKLHIARYESMANQWGYNIREGGSNGSIAPETKIKMSKKMLGEKNHQYKKPKTLETRSKLSLKGRGKYPGAHFRKNRNPEKRCWVSKIKINNKPTRLGHFEDPISASLVYNIVWNEIYNMKE